MPLKIDDLKKAMPDGVKLTVTQQMVDTINKVAVDDIMAGYIRENFVTYTSVMMDGKYTSEEYTNAIMYCTFKLMGLKNKDAYMHALPDRYMSLKSRGATEKEISAYVAAFHKGKLVSAIMEQALIPMWLVNQDAYQKAINTQVRLMTTATSELVQTQAANSILTHLAKPKDAVPQIAIQVNAGNGLAELQDSLIKISEKQLELISQGVSAKEIAAQMSGGRNVIDQVD